MSDRQPLDSLADMVAVASPLDFMCSVPGDRIPGILRRLTLLSGRALIPDAFLLHNREVLSLWLKKEGKADLREFCEVARPVISIASASHLATFKDHYEASKSTDNPSLLPEDIRGYEFARDLDSLTGDCEFRTYEHTKRLGHFEKLFRKEARPSGLPDFLVEELIAEARKLAERPQGYAAREQLDGYQREWEGITRSNIIRLLDHPPTQAIHRNRDSIRKCARIAYARNVSEPLRYAWQECQLPVQHEDHLGRAKVYHVREDTEIAEILRDIRSWPDLHIDWDAVDHAPWPHIRAIIAEANPGGRFLQCKRNLMREGTLNNLLATRNALIEYCRNLAVQFPGSGSSAVTRLWPIRTGCYVVLPLLCIYAGWKSATFVANALVWSVEHLTGKAFEKIRASRRQQQEEMIAAKMLEALTSFRWLEDKAGGAT